MKNGAPEYFFDLSSFKHREIFHPITHIWDVISQIKFYLKNISTFKIEVDIPKGVYLINPETISIGKGSVVEEGAYIKGPCIIGENSVIRHGAYIRGDLLAGDRVVIGHDTEIKNTIMLNDAHAAHFAYLGDSLIGNKVNLGAGTKCANFKLDGKEITVLLDGVKIVTGLRKLGAIIGDGCQIGCNSVTNPGTLLGKNVLCYPCTNLDGFIESDSLVRPDTKNIVKKLS